MKEPEEGSGLIVLPGGDPGKVVCLEDATKRMPFLARTRSAKRRMAQAIIEAQAKKIDDLMDKLKEFSRAVTAICMKVGGSVTITKEMMDAVRPEKDTLAYYPDPGTGRSVFYVVTPEKVEEYQKSQLDSAASLEAVDEKIRESCPICFGAGFIPVEELGPNGEALGRLCECVQPPPPADSDRPGDSEGA